MTNGSRRKFLIEAFVAAGPRKSSEEYRRGAKELCENCTGYMNAGESSVFWLCDGTSDGMELAKRSVNQGLNCRILARDIMELAKRSVNQGLNCRILARDIGGHFSNAMVNLLSKAKPVDTV